MKRKSTWKTLWYFNIFLEGGIKKKVVGGLCKNAHANATSHVLEIRGSICEGFVNKGFETSYSDHLHHHLSLHNTPIIPILHSNFLILIFIYRIEIYIILSIFLLLFGILSLSLNWSDLISLFRVFLSQKQFLWLEKFFPHPICSSFINKHKIKGK